jgi:uncharacterized membrane protein
MPIVETSIDIEVPVSLAYQQWTQFEAFPRFMTGVREVARSGDRRLHWRAEIFGRLMDWDAEITEQVPETRVGWRKISGAKNTVTVTLSPLSPSETRVTVRLEYEPENLAQAVTDLLGSMRRRVEGSLHRLKELLEQGDVEPAPMPRSEDLVGQ